jgi:transposase
MNIHKNARTTPQSRAMLVHRVLVERWPVAEVAMSAGVSTRTVYKWLARYRGEGVAGLQDRSSAARHHPHALPPAWIALVRLLRQARLVAAEIAARLPLARSTISAVLARIGLSRLRYLSTPQPVQRYEWQRPGELVHVDIKKLGRFTRAGHRVTGHRQVASAGQGWEYAHVAIDDCSRFGYVEILPDQKRYTTTRFWLRAVREFQRRGIHVQRVLTDNGGAYLPGPSARPAAGSASPPNGRDLTGHKPMAKRNASSRPFNANGPTQCPTQRPNSDGPPCPAGCASTTKIDPMLAFINKHQSADWLSSLNNGRRNHN